MIKYKKYSFQKVLNNKIAIHCPTRESWLELLRILETKDIKVNYRTTHPNHWHQYGAESIMYICEDSGFANLGHAISLKQDIISVYFLLDQLKNNFVIKYLI